MSKPFIVSNSMLSTYRTCSRKGYLRYEERLDIPTTAPAPKLGAAVHAGIASFLKFGVKEVAMQEAINEMQGAEVNDGDEWRSPERAIAILTRCFEEKYPTPLEVKGKKAVEIKFDLPLTAGDDYKLKEELHAALYDCGFDSLYYRGIIDLIGEEGGQRLVVDHKTTSSLAGDKRKGESKSIPSKFWYQFRPHGAIPMYLWATKQLVGEYIHSMMVNAIGISANDICFGRQIFSLTEDEIHEAEYNTILQAIRILKGMKDKTNYCVFNPDSCMDYASQCTFLKLCQIAPQFRQNQKGEYNVSPERQLTEQE